MDSEVGALGPFTVLKQLGWTHIIVVLALTRIIKSVVTAQAPVATVEWKNAQVNPEVSVRTQQARTGTYVSRFAPKTDYTACRRGNQTNVQIRGE